MKNNPDILEGWDAICAYLGKNMRTVRKWAEDSEIRMPVTQMGRSGLVVSSKSLLDEWIRSLMLNRPWCTYGEVNIEKHEKEEEKTGIE